ncbi:MAG TPA: PadR family transcriptional regulator [Gemmatimonadaceae bacterium]|jgi:DNA-binding PadR family transcriptional regulator
MPDDRAQPPLSTQVFQILLSLADDDLHGYAIIQDIAKRTGNEVRLTASTLYAAVKRLLDTGWIEEMRHRPRADDDPRRRYYHLTAIGRAAARAEAQRLERLAAMARAKRLIPAQAKRAT